MLCMTFRHKNHTKNCLYSLWIAFINRLRSISQPIAFSLRSEWAHYVKWRDESEDVAQWPIVMLSGPIVSLSLPTCEPQHPMCLSHVFCLNTNHVICSSLAATLLHKYRPKYQIILLGVNLFSRKRLKCQVNFSIISSFKTFLNVLCLCLSIYLVASPVCDGDIRTKMAIFWAI